MNEKGNARPVGGSTEQATETVTTTSLDYSTTGGAKHQPFRVADRDFGFSMQANEYKRNKASGSGKGRNKKRIARKGQTTPMEENPNF